MNHALRQAMFDTLERYAALVARWKPGFRRVEWDLEYFCCTVYFQHGGAEQGVEIHVKQDLHTACFVHLAERKR